VHRPTMDAPGPTPTSSADEVALWVLSLDLSGKESIAAKIREEEVDGDSLYSFKSAQAVKDALGIPFGRANKLWPHVEALTASRAASGAGEPEPELEIAEAVAVGSQLSPDRASWDREARLGAGSFADVYQGTYRFKGRSPEPVAFKVFRGSQTLKQSDTLFQQIQAEVRVGSKLQHSHLVHLYGVVKLSEGVALVMQLGAGGSLRDRLADSGTAVSWTRRVRWLAQVADGLAYLHGLLPEAVVHRDLKAANVLLNAELTVAMVADFGLAETMTSVATQVNSSLAGKGMAGTIGWKAPETFAGHFTASSDVFSFGVTGFEAISRQFPFEGIAQAVQLGKLSERFRLNKQLLLQLGHSPEMQREQWLAENPLVDRRPDLSQAEEGCPVELVALIQRCWADEAEKRPTSTECARELASLVRELESPMPENWTPMEANAARVPVEAATDRALWEKVEARIAESLPDFRLVSLERVQNRALWRKYAAFRAELAEEHGEEAVNERELFHWAPADAVENIVSSSERGFIPQIGGGEYGSGTYFAQHAVYSVAYTGKWLSDDRR
jgi:serine/threonine protein kinase